HEPVGPSRRHLPTKNRRIQEPPEMAESRPRAGKTKRRRRSARAVLLMSAILAIVFSGLFMARSASAAPAAQAAPVAHAVPAATSGTAASSATAARAAGNQQTALLTQLRPDA